MTEPPSKDGSVSPFDTPVDESTSTDDGGARPVDASPTGDGAPLEGDAAGEATGDATSPDPEDAGDLDAATADAAVLDADDYDGADVVDTGTIDAGPVDAGPVDPCEGVLCAAPPQTYAARATSFDDSRRSAHAATALARMPRPTRRAISGARQANSSSTAASAAPRARATRTHALAAPALHRRPRSAGCSAFTRFASTRADCPRSPTERSPPVPSKAS